MGIIEYTSQEIKGSKEVNTPAFEQSVLSRYDLVIFDFDDTIVAGRSRRRESLRQTVESVGGEYRAEGFEEAYGKPLQVLIEAISPGIRYPDFVKAYEAYLVREPAPFLPGVVDCIKSLQQANMRRVIVTASLTSITAAELDGLHAQGWFDAVFGTEPEAMYAKPDPKVFPYVLEKFPEVSKPVYVGDSVTDYSFAESAEVDFIGVCAGGTTTRAEFVAAGLKDNRVVDTMAELILPAKSV